jgi:peptidoglycan/xylan/chitin deacetylase (PgdA/CDA1 family)
MPDRLDRVLLRLWHRGPGAALARRGGPHLPILLYHGVVAEPLDPPCPWQLPVSVFRRQMAHLARGTRVLPVDEALDRLYAGDLPPRTCAVTFDDGLRNNLEVAAPVLREHGIPASFHVVTERVGTNRLLWPDRVELGFRRTRVPAVDLDGLGLGRRRLEHAAARARAAAACLRVLKELPAAEKDRHVADLLAALEVEPEADPGPFALLDWKGVEALAADPLFQVSAHGANHELLSRLPDEAVRHEVLSSHATLVRRLGAAPRSFAYPNGRPRDQDDRAHAALREAGVPYGLSTIPRRAHASDDPLCIPRLNVDTGLPFLRFRMLVAGTLGCLRRLCRRAA